MNSCEKLMVVVAAIVLFEAGVRRAQTWEPLNNQPPISAGVMLLLTDGSVMVHSEPNCLTCTSTDYSSWYKLTPDANGSYVNGTWQQLAYRALRRIRQISSEPDWTLNALGRIHSVPVITAREPSPSISPTSSVGW